MTAIWNDEVADWVNANRGSICLMIFRYFPECPPETTDEFCREAYVIAMQSVVAATSINKRFTELFWEDFIRLLKHSQRHESMLRYSPDATNSPYSNVGHWYTDELFDRAHREQMISMASDTICDILSPHEKKVFHLLFGETEHGCCSVMEAAVVLKMSREAVNQACVKILRKIQEADKHVDWDGAVFNLDWQSMARSVPFTKGRLSSVFGAVLSQRERFHQRVSIMVTESIGAQYEINAA